MKISGRARAYFKLLRIDHYVKNFFVFAPAFFALKFDLSTWLLECGGFVAFSLCASSIYILNDIFDINQDRNHPLKKLRPIASGEVKIGTGYVIAMILFLFSAVASWIITVKFLIVILIYFFMNVFYSLGLKHIPILDVVIIATGFVLRVVAGSLIINVRSSMWIILVTFLLALFLAIAKRRDDILISVEQGTVRKSIDGYSLEMVQSGMVIMASVSVVAYIMYTISPDVMARFGTDKLYLTSFMVIIGILRYLQITFVKGQSGNPTQVVLRDKFLQVIIVTWLLSFWLVRYL
ncbi:MAG: decaprenyl-phosphate phosphoribosyltransferase [Candidatus Kryptoniota bacterium]